MATKPFVMSVTALRKLVDKVSQRRYGVTGGEFIDSVRNGTSDQFPESDDLTELVRKLIL